MSRVREWGWNTGSKHPKERGTRSTPGCCVDGTGWRKRVAPEDKGGGEGENEEGLTSSCGCHATHLTSWVWCIRTLRHSKSASGWTTLSEKNQCVSVLHRLRRHREVRPKWPGQCSTHRVICNIAMLMMEEGLIAGNMTNSPSQIQTDLSREHEANSPPSLEYATLLHSLS